MKSIGIVRKIDELGRIVLPKETRSILGIEEHTPLEIFVDGPNLILKKYEPGCIFCGQANHIIDFKSKKICSDCLENLK